DDHQHDARPPPPPAAPTTGQGRRQRQATTMPEWCACLASLPGFSSPVPVHCRRSETPRQFVGCPRRRPTVGGKERRITGRGGEAVNPPPPPPPPPRGGEGGGGSAPRPFLFFSFFFPPPPRSFLLFPLYRPLPSSSSIPQAA